MAELDSMIPDGIQWNFSCGRPPDAAGQFQLKRPDAQNRQLDEIAIVKRYDPDGVISGEGAMTKRFDSGGGYRFPQ